MAPALKEPNFPHPSVMSVMSVKSVISYIYPVLSGR